MQKARLRFLPALLFSFGGCEHSAPVAVQPVPQTPAAPALSAAAREQLRDRIDLSAVDRLLSTLGPEDRARFLLSFEDVEAAANGRTDVETRGVRMIIQFADPERQRLLEQVWAPYWSQLPAAALKDSAYPLAGRSLAAARRVDSATATNERKP